MAPKKTYNCAKCFTAIASNVYCIGCQKCGGWFHKGVCSGLELDSMKKILEAQLDNGYKWSCVACSGTNSCDSNKRNPSSDSAVPNSTNPIIPVVINNSGKSTIDITSRENINLTNTSVDESSSELQMRIALLVEQIKLLNQILSEKDSKYELLIENKKLLADSVEKLTNENEELKNKLAARLPSNSVDKTMKKSRNKNGISNPQNVLEKVLTVQDEDYQQSTLNNASNTVLVSNTNGQNVNTVNNIQFLTGSSDCDGLIKVVPPKKSVFISRLHKDVTEEQLQHYIKTKLDVNDAKIFKFNARNDWSEHSSFRIMTSVDSFKILLNSASWPIGVLLKEFVYRKKSRHNKQQHFLPKIDQALPPE